MKAIVGIEDYGGFSSAASAMETVQSNISMHVSKLESELEVILVDRRTGTLTPEGSAVSARARQILQEMEAIQSDLHALKHDIRGNVRMGMIGTTARWLIPILVPELKKRHPNLHFVVSEGTTTSLEARLHIGTLDLALVNKPPYSKDFAFKSFFDEEYVLYISSSHPLASKKSVTIAEMDQIDLIAPPKGIPFRDLLDTLAKRSNTEFNMIIIVDADDPSHAESSRPVWASHQVARARVSRGQTAVMLSSTPSVEMMFEARTRALARPQERSGWPKVLVKDISEASGSNPLISTELISQIRNALNLGVKQPVMTPEGLIDYDGVILLYNRLGGARALICSKCNKVVSCVACSTILMQAGPGHLRESSDDRRGISRNSRPRLEVTGLRCPRCHQEYPAICTNCMSGSLRVATFGIARFRTLLEAAIGTSVSEIDASSDIDPLKLGLVVVGTEAIFSRFNSAKMVVIADFDQYLYAPGLNANEVALSILSRAAKLLPPRSTATRNVPLYIQTRDVKSVIIRSAIEADPRLATTEEAELRKRLRLPPFGAVIRVFGPKAAGWLEKSGIGLVEFVEVIPAGDGSFDLRCDSKVQLLDLISECRLKVPASGVRFLSDPV